MKDTDVRAYLDFLRSHGFIVGEVDDVDERGFKECPGYPASRLKLTILARHWMSVLYSTHLHYWFTEMSSWDCPILSDASWRLGQLEKIIGKNDMAKVEQEVVEQCRMKWGEETWDAFNRNDTEWLGRELGMISAEQDSKDKARNTPETPSPDA
jgi:hypothetical protein